MLIRVRPLTRSPNARSPSFECVVSPGTLAQGGKGRLERLCKRGWGKCELDSTKGDYILA
jgi:hypothetical protein